MWFPEGLEDTPFKVNFHYQKMSLFLAQFFMTRFKLCENQINFLELIFEQKTTPR